MSLNADAMLLYNEANAALGNQRTTEDAFKNLGYRILSRLRLEIARLRGVATNEIIARLNLQGLRNIPEARLRQERELLGEQTPYKVAQACLNTVSRSFFMTSQYRQAVDDFVSGTRNLVPNANLNN